LASPTVGRGEQPGVGATAWTPTYMRTVAGLPAAVGERLQQAWRLCVSNATRFVAKPLRGEGAVLGWLLLSLFGTQLHVRDCTHLAESHAASALLASAFATRTMSEQGFALRAAHLVALQLAELCRLSDSGVGGLDTTAVQACRDELVNVATMVARQLVGVAPTAGTGESARAAYVDSVAVWLCVL